MTQALIGLAFVGGYVASIYSWDRLHTFFVGAEAKAQALRDKAKTILSAAK